MILTYVINLEMISPLICVLHVATITCFNGENVGFREGADLTGSMGEVNSDICSIVAGYPKKVSGLGIMG